MTTLATLVDISRQAYNAVGDRFFSDEEIYRVIYEAEMQLAIECEVIEEIYTTSTVAAQREYDYPTRALRISRITYAGQRLRPIDFVEDDVMTGAKETTTATGSPTSYAIFADRLFLRPTPSAVGTIKIYAVVEPSEPTAITSSMTVPQRYRLAIKDYVLSYMFAKDKNRPMVSHHDSHWQQTLANTKRFQMKREIGDQYKIVKPFDFVDETWG